MPGSRSSGDFPSGDDASQPDLSANAPDTDCTTAGHAASAMTCDAAVDSGTAQDPRSSGPDFEETAPGMLLTASTWLPADLLAMLGDVAGHEDGGTRVAAAFRQGGPLDQMPPGATLGVFLADAADITAADAGHHVPPCSSPVDESAETAAMGHPADVPAETAATDQQADAQPDQQPDTQADAQADTQADQQAPPLASLNDAELIGLIRGWRRQASLAAAGELAAVAEFAARRQAQAKAAGEWNATAFSAADAEIAAALTLTTRSAGALTDRATALRALPATFQALAAGQIDMPRALVLINGLADQPPALARTIEARLIGRAPAQTTGELRAALHRALLAADPDAAERRRQDEERQAFLERLPEASGVTATLAGRHLPVTATVAAWNRITALARQLKTSGTPGTLDQLRVHVYLALLSGQALSTAGGPASSLARPAAPDQPTDAPGETTAGTDVATGAPHGDPGTPDPGGSRADANQTTGPPPTDTPATDRTTGTSEETTDSPHPATDAPPTGHPATDTPPTGYPDPASPPAAAPADPARTAAATARPAASMPPGDTAGPGARRPDPPGAGGLTGTVNLTMPLSSLLGLTDMPGELAGFGPVTAHSSREIALGTLSAPGVRWCVTVTGDTGQAVGHGCATRSPLKRAGPARPAWTFTMRIKPLADAVCGHERESASYRPPPLLRHLVQLRNQRCTAPGCRMPAVACDEDHTVPFDQGGRTCECNLGPLCRHHHRCKQADGWRLEQPEPGVFAWVTPSGWTYFTGPVSHAA